MKLQKKDIIFKLVLLYITYIILYCINNIDVIIFKRREKGICSIYLLKKL